MVEYITNISIVITSIIIVSAILVLTITTSNNYQVSLAPSAGVSISLLPSSPNTAAKKRLKIIIRYTKMTQSINFTSVHFNK